MQAHQGNKNIGFNSHFCLLLPIAHPHKKPYFCSPPNGNNSMMRWFLFLVLFLGLIAPLQAQLKIAKKDPYIFSVNNVPVSVDDFTRLYNKNSFNKSTASSQQEVEEYIQLLINFKLKIAEAYARGLDTTARFKKEYKTYREELKKPYRTEPDALEQLTRQTYQRLTEEVKASHILISVKPEALPADTLAAYRKLDEVRTRVLAGEDFEKLASELSEDPSAKYNFGNLGYFTALQMVYPFEDAAYNTKPGELSPIVRTQFGYHLLKVFDRKPSRGEVEVSHILLRMSSEGDNSTKNKAFDIYDQLKAGRNWDEAVKEYSDDTSTKDQGGRLRPFGVGALASVPQFEAQAFAMNEPGQISDPFQSNIGWHIIRLERKIPLAPYNEMETTLKRRLSRDERLQLSKKELTNKRRKEYAFKENNSVKSSVFQFADSTLVKGKWKFMGSSELLTQTLFYVQEKSILVSDFIKYIYANQSFVSISPALYITQLYEELVEEQISLAEDEKLQRENPDFKHMLTEYKEGILLFDIMENEVWNKASEDTVGQRIYYEANKSTYQAGDRVEARILSATERGIIEEFINKVNTGDSLTSTDYKKFKTVQPFRIYERKDSKVIEKVNWTVGLHDAESDGQFYLVEIKRLIPPGVKSLEEARAAVVSDYQDSLENEWVASLKKKYPVKVNNKVKKSVLAELTEAK